MPLRGAPLTQGDHFRPLLELQRERSLTIPGSLGDLVGWNLPYDWMEEPGRLTFQWPPAPTSFLGGEGDKEGKLQSIL